MTVVSKEKQDDIVIKMESTPFVKGHKYKIELIVPQKPKQNKLIEYSDYPNEAWALKSDRYCEIFQDFISRCVFDEMNYNLDFWEEQAEIIQTDFSDEYLDFLKVIELKNPKPTRLKMYVYGDKINKDKLSSSIKDAFENIYEDKIAVLGIICYISKIKELPKEVERKTIRIPIKKVLDEMEKKQ